VAVHITLAYDARSGDNTADDKSGTQRSGFTVVDDAYVDFQDFLGFEQFGAILGRQPFAWNLRENHAAFMYDSFAGNPRVTSWDGARLSWNISDGVDAVPIAYSMPGAGTLFGGGLNWKPPRSGDSRIFMSYLFTWENSPPMRRVAPYGSGQSEDSTLKLVDGKAGDKLLTHDVQGEFQLGDVDLFAEGVLQRGDQGDTIQYAGYGGYAGFDWHLYQASAWVVGAQFDYRSGNDEDPAITGKQRALISNWSGQSDTLIVEHQRYGGLSHYLTDDGANSFRPGLTALKLRTGVAFDDQNKVRFDVVYGWYRAAQGVGADGERDFGHEGDLILRWDYTWNVRFKLFAAGFLPRGAYTATAPAGSQAGTDLIYLLGGNLTVGF
jgi:hypothetical protein